MIRFVRVCRKLNERQILKAADFEELLTFLKTFHLNAQDSAQFLKICFDKLFIGAFPMSKITALRVAHKQRIQEVPTPLCSFVPRHHEV